MVDLAEAFWTVSGLIILGIATYVVTRQVIMPRFGSPWLSRRRREAAIEKARTMLADPGLDEDARYQLQRCLSTLESRGRGREMWGGNVPEGEMVERIDRLWSEQQDS